MKKSRAQSSRASRLRRALLRSLLLGLMCALVQALQPGYLLGVAELVPLALALGLASAVALARGLGVLPAAVLGTGVGAWQNSHSAAWSPEVGAVLSICTALLLGAQAGLLWWLMRYPRDSSRLQLDSWPHLQRLVLVAAPLAALLGSAGSLGLAALATGNLESAWSAAGLAHATGRWVVDWAGIVVMSAVVLCWLGRPIEPWRPRRKLVAWPLALAVLVLLPGLHELARRDEQRLKVRFEHEARARQRQLQQLLTEPLAAVAAARGVLVAGGPNYPGNQFDQLAAGWTNRLPGLRALGWLVQDSSDPTTLAMPHAHLAQDSAQALASLRGASGLFDAPATVRQAVLKALDSEAPTTARLPSTGRAGEGALLVLQAVPGDAPGQRRIAFGLVDTQSQLDTALPDADDQNLRVCIFDSSGSGPNASASAGASLALGSAAVLAGPAACAVAPAKGAVQVEAGRLSLADRTLSLLSIEPPSADNRLFTAVWLLALPSLLGLGMLATLLLAITGRMRRIEDRVQERTALLQAEIDERRRTERALAHTEQRFRAIFESVNIGVTLVDPQGILQMANPAFCAMMGCDAAALVGRPLAEFKLPDVAEDDGTAQALGGHLAKRQRYLTSDGRVLQVAASLRQLHDVTGEPVGTVGALHDLTQMLRLREVERARDEAEVANRTKSDFLARLSHELRTPLNAIVGFAQMVDDTGGGHTDTPHLQRSLARIRQAGWHLLDMVNDVLDLSRMEAGTLQLRLAPVALAEVAEEAMAMLENKAREARVQLVLSLSPRAEWVQADALRLRQVLLNLVANGIQYNRPGGRVSVSTQPAGLGEVLVEVEDTGVGIAADQIEALFRPFYRLGRKGEQGALASGLPDQGTGIGLVICRRLLALMGGSLEVRSQPGSGSVFSVLLPAAQAGGPRTEQATGAAPLTSQVSIGQVLYLEDNPADQASMHQLLANRPGISLTTVDTAAEGLVLAAQADVLLLDLDLPDHSGMAVLRAVRSDHKLRALSVIVVSAETRADRIDACFDAGATAFFSKPLEAGPLLRALDDALQTR